MKQTILTILIVIALSLAATGCITYNETSDPADPEVVYVTQTPEIVYATQTPEPTPTPTIVTTPTPALSSTKVVPKTFPTPEEERIVPTPMVKEWSHPECKIRAEIGTLAWADPENIYFSFVRGDRRYHDIAERISIPKEYRVEGGPPHEDHVFLQYLKIFVDDQLVAEFKPTVVEGNWWFGIEELPMVISVPGGVDANGEITVVGSFEYPEFYPYTGDCWYGADRDGDYSMFIEWHGQSIDEDFGAWNHY